MNRTISAVAAKQIALNTQPVRRLSTFVAADGVPMMTTSTAMPRTPPIWRALELTADAVANRPPGTAPRAALPSTGSVAPTPMPERT